MCQLQLRAQQRCRSNANFVGGHVREQAKEPQHQFTSRLQHLVDKHGLVLPTFLGTWFDYLGVDLGVARRETGEA